MAGLNDTDIRLDDGWQLTPAATGDAPVCSGYDCLLQDIRLEAVSQTGELFYDAQWGWGLAEFLHSVDDDLTRLEITQRVKEKLRRRREVDGESVAVTVIFSEDCIRIGADFAFTGEETTRSLRVELSRISVEVNVDAG